MKRLGVNIDHVATLRNARGESHPNPIEAAKFVKKLGADSITIHLREDKKTTTARLFRRDSTATEMKFPMFLIPLNQLQRLYGGQDAKNLRIEAHQVLKERGELVRWEDLPFDAHIIFVSHEWVGWNHPDPYGIQLRTFLRVMERLRNGEISQVEMNVFHTMMYKTNHIVKSSEWKEILSSAYIWFDWGSMPQPSAYPPGTPKKKIEKSQTDLRNAVGSIPSYVEKSDFVVIVAPGCLHADRRDPETKLRTKTCYRTYVANDFLFLK